MLLSFILLYTTILKFRILFHLLHRFWSISQWKTLHKRWIYIEFDLCSLHLNKVHQKTQRASFQFRIFLSLGKKPVDFYVLIEICVWILLWKCFGRGEMISILIDYYNRKKNIEKKAQSEKKIHWACFFTIFLYKNPMFKW